MESEKRKEKLYLATVPYEGQTSHMMLVLPERISK
jgi:hypothetical protein